MVQRRTELSSNSKIALALTNLPLLVLTCALTLLPVLTHLALWGSSPGSPERYGAFFNAYALVPAALYALAYAANLWRKHQAAPFPVFNWGAYGLASYALAFALYLWLAGGIQAVNPLSWGIPTAVLLLCAVHFTVSHRALLWNPGDGAGAGQAGRRGVLS